MRERWEPMQRTVRRTRSLRFTVVAVLTLVSMTAGPLVPSALAAGGGANVSLSGVVASGDRGAPIAGARVYAVHLDTKQVFTSAPSAANGEYQLTGLPYGYFDIAVETTDGLYLANRVINAPAGEKVEISLMLGPPRSEDQWWSAEPNRRIPGLDRVPDGVARIVEGGPGAVAKRVVPPAATKTAAAGPVVAKGTGAGVGAGKLLVPLLVAGGILGLAILIDDQSDDNDETPASVFVPR